MEFEGRFWPGRLCNSQIFALMNFRLKISPLVATTFGSFSGNETSNWVTGWPSGEIFYFDSRLLEVWGSNPGREKEICVHLVISVMLYMLWLLYIEFLCVLLWFLVCSSRQLLYGLAAGLCRYYLCIHHVSFSSVEYVRQFQAKGYKKEPFNMNAQCHKD